MRASCARRARRASGGCLGRAHSAAWRLARPPLVGAGRAAGRGRRRPSGRPLPLAAVLVVLLVLVIVVEEIGGADDVGDVEEAVALEAEVDEGRLHARQDLRHAALVDIADDAAIALALDEDLGDQIVLENGHTCFVAVRGDDHFFVHMGWWSGQGW